VGALNEIKPYLASQHLSGTLQRVECNVAVGRIKQSGDLAAAGVHPLRHAGPRQSFSFHRFFDLPCQNFLNGNSLERFARSIVIKNVIKGRQPFGTARLLRCHGTPAKQILSFAFEQSSDHLLGLAASFDEAMKCDQPTIRKAEQQTSDPIAAK
jgi:hypothetical protein